MEDMYIENFKVNLNGNWLNEEQFEAKKKEIKESAGMKLVEVTPNTYRTRLED